MNYYYRPFPPVDPTVFQESANKELALLNDVRVVLEKISTSSQYSADIMKAAQESNQTQIEKLVRSSGVKKIPAITYTPDGLRIKFTDSTNGMECCHLAVKLRWR